jgi:hypothetical protein
MTAFFQMWQLDGGTMVALEGAVSEQCLQPGENRTAQPQTIFIVEHKEVSTRRTRI